MERRNAAPHITTVHLAYEQALSHVFSGASPKQTALSQATVDSR